MYLIIYFYRKKHTYDLTKYQIKLFSLLGLFIKNNISQVSPLIPEHSDSFWMGEFYRTVKAWKTLTVLNCTEPNPFSSPSLVLNLKKGSTFFAHRNSKIILFDSGIYTPQKSILPPADWLFQSPFFKWLLKRPRTEGFS